MPGLIKQEFWTVENPHISVHCRCGLEKIFSPKQLSTFGGDWKKLSSTPALTSAHRFPVSDPDYSLVRPMVVDEGLQSCSMHDESERLTCFEHLPVNGKLPGFPSLDDESDEQSAQEHIELTFTTITPPPWFPSVDDEGDAPAHGETVFDTRRRLSRKRKFHEISVDQLDYDPQNPSKRPRLVGPRAVEHVEVQEAAVLPKQRRRPWKSVPKEESKRAMRDARTIIKAMRQKNAALSLHR